VLTAGTIRCRVIHPKRRWRRRTRRRVRDVLSVGSYLSRPLRIVYRARRPVRPAPGRLAVEVRPRAVERGGAIGGRAEKPLPPYIRKSSDARARARAEMFLHLLLLDRIIPFRSGSAKCLFARSVRSVSPTSPSFGRPFLSLTLSRARPAAVFLACENERETGESRVVPRPAARALAKTHFLFGVNHAEVYNNIKFPFTRFAGSALFLRQKTHSLHRAVRTTSVYLSYVTSTVPTECVWFFFLLRSFLIFGSLADIIGSSSSPSPILYALHSSL